MNKKANRYRGFIIRKAIRTTEQLNIESGIQFDDSMYTHTGCKFTKIPLDEWNVRKAKVEN